MCFFREIEIPFVLYLGGVYKRETNMIFFPSHMYIKNLATVFIFNNCFFFCFFFFFEGGEGKKSCNFS